MAQQDPSKRKDNKKSTPTSNISPGEPLWNDPPHDQESYGPGYDNHDPVSLLKGDVRNRGGGYVSGNALTRFGLFTLPQGKYFTKHGEVVEIKILRNGGSKGEFVFDMQLDRETGSQGGVPVDENTAIVGDYKTSTKDGFNICSVDVDMKTLNTGPGFVYDSDEDILSITFKGGEEEKLIKLLIPYKTDVRSMLPTVLSDTLTYKIDEYEMVDGLSLNIPMLHSDLVDTDCTALVTGNSTVLHHQTNYTAYTLPLPYFFTQPEAGNPAPIDDWQKPGQEYIVRHAYDDVSYRVGKTRTAEAMWKFSVKHAKLNTVACSALSADYPDLNFGRTRVLTNDGVYTTLSGVDWQPRTDGSGGLSAAGANVKYKLTSDKLTPMSERSGYETHALDVGDDPNLLFNMKQTAPGGDSEFKYLTEPYDLLQKTGDQFNVGDITWTMFTTQGINPALLNDGLAVYKLKNTDVHSMSGYNNGATVPLDNIIHPSLSSYAGLNQFTKNLDPPNVGVVNFDDWINHDDTGTLLYSVSSLVHPASADQLNSDNLRGYYMTCKDHQSRKAYFKIRGNLVEEPYDTDVMDFILYIDKEDSYDVSKHAGYDATVNPKYVLKHAANTAPTFIHNSSWDATPTGDGLLGQLFSPFAVYTKSISPPLTGYTSNGPISADDIRFISIEPGVLPGQKSTPPPGGTIPAPELTVTPDEVIKAVARNVQNVENIVYENTGGGQITVSLNTTLHDVTLGEIWTVEFNTLAGGATIHPDGGFKYILPANGSVTMTYKVTPAGNAGEEADAKHLIQVDKGVYGISTQNTTFSLTIN